jgi:hypothetical protein
MNQLSADFDAATTEKDNVAQDLDCAKDKIRNINSINEEIREMVE